jgi:arylformamidase
MDVFDISRRIEPTAAVYPGDDPLGTATVCAIGEEDAPCNITALNGWTTHFLTHVDAPRHFLADGATLDEIPLERFTSEAVIVNVDSDSVTKEDVPENITDKAVLFKTRNSSVDPSKFDEQHVYIDASAVEVLVERRPNLVGIDYLSVDRFGDEEYPAHRGLLSADVLILEGLDLSNVEADSGYTLVALPLRIIGADGSPTRAVLLRS